MFVYAIKKKLKNNLLMYWFFFSSLSKERVANIIDKKMKNEIKKNQFYKLFQIK